MGTIYEACKLDTEPTEEFNLVRLNDPEAHHLIDLLEATLASAQKVRLRGP